MFMYIVQRMTLLKTTKQILLWIRLYSFESRFKNDSKLISNTISLMYHTEKESND